MEQVVFNSCFAQYGDLKEIGKKSISSGHTNVLFQAKKELKFESKNLPISTVAIERGFWKDGVKTQKNKKIFHDNILKIEDEFIASDDYYVAEYPFMDTSIRKLLNESFGNGMNERLACIVIKEALKALDYLHKQGHCIYNLNPDSIYFKFEGCEEPSIKLGFASSSFIYNSIPHPKKHQSHLPFETISIWGCAPEIKDSVSNYCSSSDIWLLGVLGIEILLGGIRARNRHDFLELIKKVLSNDDDGQKKQMGCKKEKSFNLSWTCRDFLKKCLKSDPMERPSAEILLKHGFIASSKDLEFFQDCIIAVQHAVAAAAKKEGE